MSTGSEKKKEYVVIILCNYSKFSNTLHCFSVHCVTLFPKDETLVLPLGRTHINPDLYSRKIFIKITPCIISIFFKSLIFFNANEYF